MEAPIPINNFSINMKITENNDKKYNLIINNSSNILLINIINENSLPKIEFYKEFTPKELAKNGKFFKVFDDTSSIYTALKELFESKKPKISEEKEYIKLTIVPNLLALGESDLIIPRKKTDDKKVINDLCDVVNSQGKEINILKNKIKILEEKIDVLEKKIENNIILRRIKKENTLIGDIIKTNEQMNLICDWIDREKAFKFKLLYKGTTDGDTKEIFHKRCDNKGSTISIIESTDGQIFGGYASKSWNKNKSDIPDPDSFLFNVNNKRKYSVSNNKGLVGNSYICYFGGTDFYELEIDDNFLLNGGCCGNGKGYNFKKYELSGGKSSFSIKELEIYKVEEN